MPGWAKVAIWAVVFATCAAAGAWVASRTDPFPPGVEDPGARPADEESTETPSPAASPVWRGSLVATTEHRLHVGGTCRSDWSGTYRMRLRTDGTIGGGEGTAAIRPDTAGCDFSQAQLQADTVQLTVDGTWERRAHGFVLDLRFRAGGLDPAGAIDLGGFLVTIDRIRPQIEQASASGSYVGDADIALSDRNQGRYVARYTISADCRSGCS